jgi:hypothetical protein
MAATGRGPGLAVRRVDVVGPHPSAQLAAHLDGLQIRLDVVVRVHAVERELADTHLMAGDHAGHPGHRAGHSVPRDRVPGHRIARHTVNRHPVEGRLDGTRAL